MVTQDAANPDLLARIPHSARAVLEVGCGTGATLAAHRARNPSCLLFGIEPDPALAAIARQRLDAVAETDAEDIAAPFGAQRFDCILYSTSLERMRAPWDVLAQHARLLTPEGLIAICIANVEHWSFTAFLLGGGFDYRQSGLFDRAHLRWFTVDSMHKTLTEAGLHPLDVIGRVFDGDAAAQFAEKIAPGLQALGVDQAGYVRRATPLQYVWRATAKPATPMLIISTMLDPVGGVSEVRVGQPMQALASEPGLDVRVLDQLELPIVTDDTPRIFVFHRPRLIGAQSIAVLRQIQDAGYVTVCEFDDHPDYLPVLQHEDVLNFTGVHAVQTTTPHLAGVLAQRNPNVAVFPNAVPFLEPPRNFGNPERLTLFFGSLNRQSEWPELMPALNDILREADGRLHVQVVTDEAFFHALETPHKTFTPLCDYATYRAMLAGCEISLMPLRDTPFNRCKSDLKHIEAAAARVVSLASSVVYGESIEHGRTGLIFHSPEQMRDQLRQLLADPQSGRAMADAARQHVAQNRMLAQQVAARRDWYRQIWERRAVLRADIGRRVPQLSAT